MGHFIDTRISAKIVRTRLFRLQIESAVAIRLRLIHGFLKLRVLVRALYGIVGVSQPPIGRLQLRHLYDVTLLPGGRNCPFPMKMYSKFNTLSVH